MRWILISVCVCAVGCGDDGGSDDGGGTAASNGASAGDDDGADDGSGDDGGTAGDDGGTGAGESTGGVDATVGDDGAGDDDAVDDGGGDDWSDQCQGDADCEGGTCVALVEGGVQVCVIPPFEATECPLGPNGERLPHECCNSGECEAGICVSSNYGPVCSGAQQLDWNMCVVDMCTSHDDCQDGQACIPAGALALPVATCWPVQCLTDSDCTDSPGGDCVIAPSTTCCGDNLPRCRYPDSPPIGDECPP